MKRLLSEEWKVLPYFPTILEVFISMKRHKLFSHRRLHPKDLNCERFDASCALARIAHDEVIKIKKNPSGET